MLFFYQLNSLKLQHFNPYVHLCTNLTATCGDGVGESSMFIWRVGRLSSIRFQKFIELHIGSTWKLAFINLFSVLSHMIIVASKAVCCSLLLFLSFSLFVVLDFTKAVVLSLPDAVTL